jgi:phage terminase small subunit
MKQKNPPAHLTPEAVALFDRIMEERGFTDPAVIARLVTACELLDRAESCRKRIAQDGELVKDRFGAWKPHGLLQSERAARSELNRILQSLPAASYAHACLLAEKKRTEMQPEDGNP